jgi:hypothetical protein
MGFQASAGREKMLRREEIGTPYSGDMIVTIRMQFLRVLPPNSGFTATPWRHRRCAASVVDLHQNANREFSVRG